MMVMMPWCFETHALLRETHLPGISILVPCLFIIPQICILFFSRGLDYKSQWLYWTRCWIPSLVFSFYSCLSVFGLISVLRWKLFRGHFRLISPISGDFLILIEDVATSRRMSFTVNTVQQFVLVLTPSACQIRAWSTRSSQPRTRGRR